MNTIKFSLVGAAVVVALFGCNSDSNTITTTTPVTLSVSDAPIDDVSEVVITYSKVAFLPLDGGSPQIFEVYKTDEEGNYVDENGDPIPDGEDPLPLSVNLLNYQGSDVQELVEDEVIPSGNYKLCVFANDGDHPDYPSYVIDEATGNQIPLTVKGDGACPQGVGKEPNSGVLFFNNTFAVNPDNNEFVVEFDLRRGLKDGTGQNEGYSIQRTSVTLINTVTTGEIQAMSPHKPMQIAKLIRPVQTTMRTPFTYMKQRRQRGHGAICWRRRESHTNCSSQRGSGYRASQLRIRVWFCRTRHLLGWLYLHCK